MQHRLIGLGLSLLLLTTPVFAEEAITGQVAFDNEEAASHIHIAKAPIPLASKLKKKYAAYRMTVTSDYPHTLHLASGSLTNGVHGQVAASNSHTSWGWVLVGLPLWLLGMGVAAIVIANKNERADTEAMGYTNNIPNFDLGTNDSATFNVLVPVSQEPQVQMRFRDIKTNDMIMVNSL